jgi:hypothetical protein
MDFSAGAQLPPRAACSGHEHGGGQDRAIVGSPSATTLRPLRRRRHHALKQLPQLVRNQLI